MQANNKSGFTLIELGIVLVILSLMASGVLAIATQNIRVAKQKELKMKLDAIEYAVKGFRKANGYIPCPADIDLADTHENFGFQAVDPGSCTDGDGTDLNPDIDLDFVDGNTAAGAVPVRNLGLTDEYAYDPWGGRFLYAVDRRATSAASFTPVSLTDTSLIGSIEIKDAGATNTLTSTALLLVLSHGPNGHGAYQRGGARKFVGSANADEQENCDCNTSAATTFDDTFIMAPASSAFDDVVRYFTRAQLYSETTDMLTENR